MGSFATSFTNGDVVDAADLNTIAGAWNSFTVTLSGITLGNGTAVGFWKKIGRAVHYRVEITLGSTSSVTGAITIDLPATAAATSQHHSGYFYDLSATTSYAMGVVFSTTQIFPRALNSAGTYATLSGTTSTIPFTWATGDLVRVAGSYESAS